MNWNIVRIELGRTRDFPQGSASRAYLLRLPLDDGGAIDEGAILSDPAHATVRRFWPNERDRSGRIVATPEGWAVRYDPGDAEEGAVYRLETAAVHLGGEIRVTEPDGRLLPFRVASLGKPPEAGGPARSLR
ncbi:MAG TPA: hypothetical protein VEZ20_09365 [Allosphingosinicella sp.]|nr:hypothetical protein [Allosphingosinicella sp.]